MCISILEWKSAGTSRAYYFAGGRMNRNHFADVTGRVIDSFYSQSLKRSSDGLRIVSGIRYSQQVERADVGVARLK